MRRLLLLTFVAAIQVGLMATVLEGPAGAKGWEHTRLTLLMQGASGEIARRGEEAWMFLDELGVYELKWDVPNVDATLDPDIDTGDAYRLHATLSCGHAERSSFEMTLFPRAEGGPQLFIEHAKRLCDGTPVEPGWLPLRSDTLRPFYRLGLPRPQPEAPSTARSTAALAASTRTPPTSSVAAWFAGGLVGLGLLGGVGLVVRRSGGRR